MIADIFIKRQKNFVLWRASDASAPEVIISRLQLGAPVHYPDEQRFALIKSPEFSELWMIPAADCNLEEGKVYHYWFEVTDAHPERSGERIRVTDPFAYMVDWRLSANEPAGVAYTSDDAYPPAVIMFKGGMLVPCDAGGEIRVAPAQYPLSALAPNNRMVMYELPTTWTRTGTSGEREFGLGTFNDVRALVTPAATGANFSDMDISAAGRSYLHELGINALELLPPADSFYQREWGYGTTNFFAPDFDLGYPENYSWPAPNRDLHALIDACHEQGVRFFADVVMAFSRTNAYLAVAPDDFFILHPEEHPTDPDAHNSRSDQNLRNGFGSTLFRYARFVNGYDPVSGNLLDHSPGRQLMKAALLRWMNDFNIDGIRMDSVENIANWDFIREYKDLARATWRERYASLGNTGNADERFLVVGEELSEPPELMSQQRLDGLWHENFKRYLRAAIIGKVIDGEPDFVTMIGKMIDCRTFGYTDLSQAIIYLTSHDVEGLHNERAFNYLQNAGIGDPFKRIKLAFACLLTSVGIPMILAGEEFADEHDLFDKNGHVSQNGGKQVDPVNFFRLRDPVRNELKEYVSRLIKFRAENISLSMNDTELIHADEAPGKRVFAWRRGHAGSDDVVVVVANFSEFKTAAPSGESGEYVIANWPANIAGKTWREVTGNRTVPADKAGREPVDSWQAMVYVME